MVTTPYSFVVRIDVFVVYPCSITFLSIICCHLILSTLRTRFTPESDVTSTVGSDLTLTPIPSRATQIVSIEEANTSPTSCKANESESSKPNTSSTQGTIVESGVDCGDTCGDK
ncbi:hypothetical protein AN958_03326 [Leucoagaricus sp. SymC.cos]|nr:hypothetical protein AN958_03326 [Leucoagaricus sp. SymC.cos]